MATTTNYGWSTPDDVSLVKDGASAIRTLGSSIDTTTKNLNPSTTLGDIEYRSSTANTNTRLGIGTSGQVLTVSGGVPAWATSSSGGMTLISTTTLSGVTTTLSSIPQTYTSLYLILEGVTGNTSDTRIRCIPNNTTLACDYAGEGTDNTVGALSGQGLTDQNIFLVRSASMDRTNSNNVWVMQFYNYTSSTRYKPFSFIGSYQNTSGGASYNNYSFGGVFKSNTALTSLVFDYGGTNTFAGGTVTLYGVK
jgi:hypothetical protein